MNKFFDTKLKKTLFIIVVIAIIEISGHGIFVSLISVPYPSVSVISNLYSPGPALNATLGELGFGSR